MPNRSVMLIVIVMLLSVVPASGSPGPDLDLAKLTREANLIVVGRVIGVSDEGRVSFELSNQSIAASRKTALLQLDRVVKGQFTQPTLAFEFLVPDQFVGYRGIGPGTYGMFFLREAAEQPYRLVSPYYPFVGALPEPPSDQRGGEMDRVVAEVTSVFLSPKAPLGERLSAVHALGDVRTKSATEALRMAASKGNLNLRLAASASLLDHNDISMLGFVEQLLLSPPTTVESYLVTSAANALGSIRTPEAIPSLVRLMEAPDATVRRQAAIALGRTGDKAAVQPLAKALGDSEQMVRYEAVLGLAKIKGEPLLSFALFQSKEDKLLSYWRERVKRE